MKSLQKVSIVIPAHNEEQRIGTTLEEYLSFFDELKQRGVLDFEIVAALNGCTDNTIGVVRSKQERYGNIFIIDLLQAGKGLALKAGFADALTRDADLIGFVDADMATSPKAYYDLIRHVDGYDGIIASRYMAGATVIPPRPFIKRWGSRLVYESLTWVLFGLTYQDLQCGAKLFKRSVIDMITPHLTVTQWAFDVEVLYLCKKFGFIIKEFPTVWIDKMGSKLTIRSGFRMLGSIIRVRLLHSPLRQFFED